jgi:HPt (histidine-containing phosphotransfer) domain-containing protein
MPNQKIEISKFNFWLITSLLGALILGIGSWATSMNSQMVLQQIAMAEMKSTLLSVDTRLKDNLSLSREIHTLKSDLRAVTVQAEANTAELIDSRGIRFNMDDYNKYVRPVNEALLERVTRIEAKLE